MQVALQTLRQLETESFTVLCRQFSECPSKLKGGDMAGDVGWLDRVKGADVIDSKKNGAVTAAVVPNVILAPAFALAPGKVSDIVISEEGVHVLQRTA
jgi:parvulin-like peptidyl-prolyl isomerase